MLLMTAVASCLAFDALLALLLFGAAGSLAHPMFWAYLLTFSGLCVGTVTLLYYRNPGLLQERIKPGAGERDKGNIQVASLLFVLHFVAAGLDVGRLHWTDSLPGGLQVAALVAYAGGFGVIVWGLLVNPYFSTAVRMQPDRGQQVVTGGPYAWVRHPGYTGGLVLLLSSGVVLGSWLAVAMMALTVPFIVQRTLLEDGMLRTELPGYAEYAQRVRWRLLPGVW